MDFIEPRRRAEKGLSNRSSLEPASLAACFTFQLAEMHYERACRAVGG
jgi:hypothetical protein